MNVILPMKQENRARIKAEATREVNAIFERRCLDLDTIVMWILHRRFGFGKDRCRRFFDEYRPVSNGFWEQYGEARFDIMREDLLRDGIDIERWGSEK